MALLNSQLLDWFIHQTSSKMRGGWFSYEARFIRNLPIRCINFDDPGEKAQHDHIAALVTEMLEVQKERAEAGRTLDDDRQHRLAKRIEEMDKAIDAAVYTLYGLTEEEIGVVEGK